MSKFPSVPQRGLPLRLLGLVVCLAALVHIGWSSSKGRSPSRAALPLTENRRLTVVTRIHGVAATTLATTDDILAFLRACESYASAVILCIGIGDDLDHTVYLASVKQAISAQTFKSALEIIVLPVVPWGKFTPALNAALGKVVDRGDGFIAFQSLEFRIDAQQVASLVDYAAKDESVLVIGPRMNGHEFVERGSYSVPLRGRTCPWNTFAIWRTRQLALTGFPMVADGLGSKAGGVEEVAAITILQQLNPALKAVLAKVPGVSWETNFTDPKRLVWHEEKMRSKDERPAKQLQWLGLEGKGVVSHLVNLA